MLYGDTILGKVCIADYDLKIHGEAKCPCCSTKLIPKRGSVKAHHFSHSSKNDCEHWTEPMTEWHMNWQLLAEAEWREIHMPKDGKLHIADIVLPGGHVVEIQHSPLSSQEIQAREAFYDDMTWILDGQDMEVVGSYHSAVVLQTTTSRPWWRSLTKPALVHTSRGLVQLPRRAYTFKKDSKWCAKLVCGNEIPCSVYSWLCNIDRNTFDMTEVKDLKVVAKYETMYNTKYWVFYVANHPEMDDEAEELWRMGWAKSSLGTIKYILT